MKLLMKILCLLLIVVSIGCSRQNDSVSGIFKLHKTKSTDLVLPVWSHSSDKLIASSVSVRDHTSTIYMFDLMTGEMTSLIQIDGEAAAYSWAPDDSHIAVAISGSNNFANGIWIFDILDGTNDFLSTGEAAVWSADGSQIAVFSCEQASNGISTRAFVRLIAFSRDKKQEVLFEDDNCLKLAYMTWSADNKSIAFSYSINTTSNKHLDKIILIDMASKEANAILADGSWSPSFSPTGEKLVYINNYALAISDKDGTCVENKDIGFGSIGDVVWSPDGSQWAVSTLGDIYIVETSKYMNQDPLGNSSSCP